MSFKTRITTSVPFHSELQTDVPPEAIMIGALHGPLKSSPVQASHDAATVIAAHDESRLFEPRNYNDALGAIEHAHGVPLSGVRNMSVTSFADSVIRSFSFSPESAQAEAISANKAMPRLEIPFVLSAN